MASGGAAQPRRIACIGGATVDRTYRAAAPLVRGTSNPVQSRESFGGVARNVAENLSRLAIPTSLVTIVGDDSGGQALIRDLQARGVGTAGVLVAKAMPTASYAAIIGPGGELEIGVADMGCIERFTPDDLDRAWPALAPAAWMFAECNLNGEVLTNLLARRREAGFKLAVDAVSTAKARRLPADLAGIDLLFLNRDEAAACLGIAGAPAEMAQNLRRRGAGQVALTLGTEGMVLADGEAVLAMAPAAADPVDVTGAGDALIAGTLCALLEDQALQAAVRTGLVLAALTTECAGSVHPDTSRLRLLDEAARRRPGTERDPA